MTNEENTVLRIAGIVRESIVDGPGIRFTLFTQGCPHHCEECHNAQTWDTNGGYDIEISKILDEIKKNPLLKGVTLSGGEPFLQPKPLAILAEQIHSLGLDTVVFSGYTFEQLLKMSQSNQDVMSLLKQTDILIDGPYIKSERDLNLKFRGSRNQRLLDCQQSLEQGIPVSITED